jgi:hypothetical protein
MRSPRLNGRSSILHFFGALAMVLAPFAARGQSGAPAQAPAARAPENQLQTLLDAVGRLEKLAQEQNRELAALRGLVQEQREKLESMERQLAGRAAAPQAVEVPMQDDVRVLEGQMEAMADSQRELGERVTKLQADSAAAARTTESRLRQLGNFSFSGDFRYRYEPFFGGPGNAAQERQRHRFRLRFNVHSRFSEEFSGGFTLASGDLNDPISTNQTLNGEFTRKPVALDRAFLEYRPRWFKPLAVTGGKFAYTWHRTELTWDNDTNPEGISQTLNFEFNGRALERVTLVGFQLPFHEVGGRGNADSTVYGGQVQSHWRLHPRVKFAGYTAFYNFHRADAVANTLRTNSVFNNLLPLGGGRVQNARTTAAPFQFASRFAVLDVIARLDVDTGAPRWPLLLQLDFANNTRPCANLPALAPGATLTAPCNPRDRSAYWADVRAGRLQERGDWTFGYSFIRIEREAVLGAFNYSDLMQNSNVVNHRFESLYMVNRNFVLSFTGLFGRPLVTTSSPKEDFLKRYQLDFIYRF